MAYLHQNNILHRDIKPENILKKDSKYLRWALGDFGLACYQTERLEIDVQVGTEAYLPPEVIERKSTHTTKADIWACGKTLLRTFQYKYPNFESGYDWFSSKSLPIAVRRVLKECLKDDQYSRPSASYVLRILN